MKRLLIAVAFILCAATVSAQGWGVGGRIGSGLEVQGEYQFKSENYVEARFGMSWCHYGGTITANFTLLHQWNIFNMDWTPKAGIWFFDAGAGINVGGREHYAYVGAAGSAKFGIKFNKVPIKLAIDWTPAFGPEILYGGGESISEFYKHGLANFGISCVYNF